MKGRSGKQTIETLNAVNISEGLDFVDINGDKKKLITLNCDRKKVELYWC